MSHFTAIIAQLADIERWFEQKEQRAVEMRQAIQDLADNATANGSEWASERAKRALAETEGWF